MAPSVLASPAVGNAAAEARPHPLRRCFVLALSGLNGLGTAWIFVMMVLINADVIARAAFNAPIRGVPLIISLSIIAIVFLQLPDALRNGRLTRNEVVLSRLEARRSEWVHPLQALFHLAGVGMMIVVLIYGTPLLEKAWKSEAYFGNLGDFTFAEWPIKFVVLVGALAAGLQFVILFCRDCRNALATASDRNKALRRLLATFAVTAAIVVAARYALASESALTIGCLSVVFMLILVYLGMHVGVALATVSFFCVLIIRDSGAISGTMLALAANESLRQYELGVIPLFVLMGMIVAISDVGKDAFSVAHQVFRRLRGGLGTATVVANAIFAAITGTSIASASVFTRIAVPEMLRIGYHPRFAVGVVAGSSVLGMLIPPSLLLIIFGILAETSIGDLFIAGIIPGVILSLAYAIQISIMAHRFPRAVYAAGMAPEERGSDTRHEPPLMPVTEMLRKIGPIFGLIAFVIGGIYGGLFTATEAGGVGALGALLIALARRKVTLPSLWKVLIETGYITAALCFLLVAAHVYARMISVSGIPGALESGLLASGLGYYGLIAIYVVLVVLLGTILDSASIMLILVPILTIIFKSMEMAGVEVGSLVWFGIVTVIAVEIGLLTPPVGLACFAIHSNLNDSRISLSDIFHGAAPFALTMLVVLLLIIAFPWLALALV
ncbi:MAG: TRAP transporter large permease subunit [Rhodospirillaceae bacterium]|nr:TRAP transporter large permease subunit [Rhodospirillaceae bacterium]